MTAVERIIPPATIEIGGAVYPLRWTFDALAEGSRIAGCDLLSHHPASVAAVLGAAQLRALLQVAGGLEADLAGGLIGAATARLVFEALCRAWLVSMPERVRGEKRSRKRISADENWRRCYAMARVRLGVTDGEFGALTPRQLRLLLDEDDRQGEERRLLFGLVAATIINVNRTSEDSPFVRPKDFFTVEKRERAPRTDPATNSTLAFLMSRVTETREAPNNGNEKDNTAAETGTN